MGDAHVALDLRRGRAFDRRHRQRRGQLQAVLPVMALVDDALPAPAVTIADAVLDVLHTDLPDRRTERMLELVDLVSRKDEQD